MAFSFEPLLAVFAGHIMAVLAGPEQWLEKALPAAELDALLPRNPTLKKKLDN